MPRSRRRGLSPGQAPALVTALTAAATALGAAACSGNDAGTAGCQFLQEITLPGDALSLLSDARLDGVGDGYQLIGSDDASVRWASLDPVAGQLGDQHVLALPAGHAGAWYGVAGARAPADTLLVAVGTRNGDTVDLRIMVQPVGQAPVTLPPGAPAVASTPAVGPAGEGPQVAMASSRLGMAAGLAWVDGAAGTLMVATVGPNGKVVSAPQAVDKAAGFDCVAFTPGKTELTLGYYKHAAVADVPSWVITEVRENGAIDSTLGLSMPNSTVRCPVLTATDAGYTMAWQDNDGSWLGVYDAKSNRLSITPFASAVTFGGPDLQPPLAGLASIGADYVVVLAGLTDVVWRLDATGARRPGALQLPSLQGKIGAVSALPTLASGGLTVTYADYTASDAGVGTAGQRFLLKATCQ